MALSPRGRVSFPSVWEASAMKGGTPKFSVTLLFNLATMDLKQKQLFSDMANAANEVAQKKFGVKLGDEYPADTGNKLRSPFRKSEEKPKHLAPGHIFVKFASLNKPGVVDESKDDITKVSGDFYAGCWAHCSWTVYAYDEGGNPGVAFGLKNVQKTGDDEAFGAERTTPDEDFQDVREPTAVGADIGGDSDDGSDDISF